MCGGPVPGTAAYVYHEIAEQDFTLIRMCYFRVKLYAKCFFSFYRKGSMRNRFGGCNIVKTHRQVHNAVGMAHPNLGSGLHAMKEFIFADMCKRSPAVFPVT